MFAALACLCDHMLPKAVMLGGSLALAHYSALSRKVGDFLQTISSPEACCGCWPFSP